MIDVVDSDPRWADWFRSLERHYRAVLAGLPIVAIEHVGSTSVPGLAAKPVIDVDIVVAAADVRRTIDAMVRVGFVSLGERGIPDRWALGAPAGLPPTNTYVVVDGSVALRNHRSVRDELRREASLRDEYAALKRTIAARVDDIDRYVEAKSALLSQILARAGMTDEERRSIEDVNRAVHRAPGQEL